MTRLLFPLVVCALAGCSEEKPAPPAEAPKPRPAPTTPSAKAPLPPCCVLPGRAALLSGKDAKAEPDKESLVELKEATLKQVLADIAKHKELVLIDIWGEFCVPCKAEFPHLVKLHQAHAKDGLVCMSIAVDEVEHKAKAHAFLKKQGAAFANYILSPDSDNWQDHWDITAVPAVLVYRDGKLLRTFTNDNPDAQYTYADVEKFVLPLLKR
jgi:thiol-disulfide isomerase/thioredoxin